MGESLRIHTKILYALILSVGIFLLPYEAKGSISDWQKGANIMPSTNTDLASDNLKRSLDKLKATGGTYVGFIIPYYQADQNATVINRGGNTPTDAALISAVSYAHSIGLNVSLKIHLETHDHEWRANINPTNRSAWFSAYGNLLNYYGTFAKNNNVEQIIIGTELIKMASDSVNPTNTANWKTMIANLRTIYSGTLTYGANWGDGNWTEETIQIKFWDKLDYIGISSYYWLDPENKQTVEALLASWQHWDDTKIKPLYTEWNKPILFTEVGYRSVVGAHNHPWNWWDTGTYDAEEQARDYQALFSYWNSKSYFKGVFLWSWEIDPNAGGAGDKGYTPQNKPAETVMREWFTNPPSPNPVAPSFTVSGQTFTTSVNQEVEASISVKNNGSQPINALIDFEVHSPQYQKLHQEYFSSQNFAAGETKTYTTKFTPTASGTYPIMVGIFNNNWSTNYLWDADAGAIVAGGSSDPAPAQSGTIDIWWPTNGSTVSGTLPFKALMTNASTDSYAMYWQVDGGQMNEMQNSNQDYPHKEAWVDVSGWNWKQSGQYKINFVTKNLSGTILSQKSVDIIVNQ